MRVRRFEDLVAWQLSAELRDQIAAVCARPAWARHGSLREDLLDAAESAPANIAEGFGRFYPKEFSRFLRIARASLMEIKNHLGDARRRGALTEGETREYLQLADRALICTDRLHQSLRRREQDTIADR
jgi:four helix bundle protein